jgi:chromate transporter
MIEPSSASELPIRASLSQLARYFLRLGFTAFGGPAAHIAIMEDDLVVRRRWLTREHFMDMLAATQLVPGPNSTEMAIHIGYVHQGLAGLILAGACFILPAFLIVLALSIFYVAYGALPAVGALFYGIQPVIVAIVIQATYRLGRSALKTNGLRALCLAALIATLLAPFDPVWVIVGGGLVGIVLAWATRARGTTVLLALPLLNTISGTAVGNRPRIPRIGRILTDSFYYIRGNPLNPLNPWSIPVMALIQAPPDAPLWRLALFFLKVGATLLGSGYLLISYLQNDLVNRYGWLTPRQLVDAIAVGQMTPGPVFTTAAFVGYVVRAGPSGDITRGTIGAAVCALAIFLPSFVIVGLIGPLMPWLRRSAGMRAFLDGVNAAVVGTIAATTWALFQAATIDLPNPVFAMPVAGVSLDLFAALLATGATALLLRERAPNSTIIIGVGAALGLIAQSLIGGI